MCIGLRVKYPLLLSYFSENVNFLDRLLKNTRIENLIKIRPIESEFFHADGRTDRYDETNSNFSQLFERV